MLWLELHKCSSVTVFHFAVYFFVYYTFQIYLHAFLPSWRKTTVSLLFLSSIFGLYALLAHVGRTRIPWRSWVKGNVVYWSFCVAVNTRTIRSVCHKCLSSTAKGQAGIPGTPGIPGKRGYRVGLEWNEHPNCLVSVIIISNWASVKSHIYRYRFLCLWLTKP